MIRLVKSGVFSLMLTAEPRGLLMWAAFAAGIVAQIVINKRAKTPERRFVFAVAVVVLMLVCEFTQYGKLLPDHPAVIYIYAVLVCMLAGLCIPAIALWIRNRKSRKAE